jgi:hypothetical protein
VPSRELLKGKTVNRAFAAFVVSFGIGSLAQAPPQPSDQQSAAPPSCSTKQDPGYMTSWAGQSSAKDHSEVRSLTKGTHLACLAIAADASKAACNVSLENDGHYTLQSHEAIRIPQDDFVTLTCKGKTPTCCKVQMTPDPSPLKKGETKPQPEPQLGIVGEEESAPAAGNGQGAR